MQAAKDSEFCIGCRADAGAILGFCRHQPAFPDELLYQFFHKAICEVLPAFFITESVNRKFLSDAQIEWTCYIQVFPFCPAPLQNRAYDLFASAFQLRPVFLVREVPISLIVVDAITAE